MYQNRNNIDYEIVLLLLKGKNHLRSISKQLDEAPTTISRRLSALLNENVIDFQIEGKNKAFFLRKNLQAKNYVFNAERHKLMKLLKKYPELDVIIEDILKKCDEKLIVLFGSYAKETAKKGSDIDIYVDTKKRNVKERIECVHSNISVKIGAFDKDAALIKEIIKNHVILKGTEEFYEKTRFFES
ncbi:MAG: nucleotidyltransferase domain-containing protein [Candidatus Aenigmarchaeota archaeon]|nr:nucleotidyltransferase domain-containing protein [Candidatus Aenigmarchaeota archaeon]